jgi:4-hydroxy-2-oxoheptanedioate aldolase
MNALRRLRAGEVVFGLFQTYPDPNVTELAAWSGYDFVVLDAEHGVQDEARQIDCMRAAQASGAFALVRVRPGDEGGVARYLDLGADGVLVPDVRGAEQARAIAFAARKRWSHGMRGDRYGAGRDPEDLPLVVLLIESPEAVEEVEAILDVEGVDGLIVGPGDLSLRMGAPGDFASPDFLAAVGKVEAAARARGKFLGAKPYAGFTIQKLVASGVRLILVGRETALFRQALSEALKDARAQAARG